MSMDYAVRRIGNVTVLDLIGRIGWGDDAFGPAPPVLHVLVRQLADTGHDKILLNLRNVTFVDSTGIGELVSSLTTLRNRGGQLGICSGNERIGNLLRTTHLDAVLNLDPDETTALEGFSAA
jgi:anti-sigma B factor antagonist